MRADANKPESTAVASARRQSAEIQAVQTVRMSEPVTFALCAGSLLLCLLMTACSGLSSAKQAQTSNPPTPPNTKTASVFFGMNQTHYAGCDKGFFAFPLFDAPVGSYRNFGGCGTLWADMNPKPNVFKFSDLDILFGALKQKGINDVLITLGNVPNWISSNPNDLLCDQAAIDNLPAGMCDPPADLNRDGTGTDLAWRTFATALLEHVTSSSYLESHAHIGFYEIWNEYPRSDTLNSTFTCHCPVGQNGCNNPGQSCAYRGTFAQMLRMTQDLRCIVEGHPDDPITATGQTCATAGYPYIGLDPTALVAEGNAGGVLGGGDNSTMQNYRYCNNDPPADSMCNYGSAGSAATDVIIGHSYFHDIPETLLHGIAAQKALLTVSDVAKPYFTGEGSWGENTDVNDPGLQAAFVPRFYLVLLMAGVQRGYWFAWDEFEPNGTGGLWAPSSEIFPPERCTVPDTGASGFYCDGGIAYIQTVNWLDGAAVVSFNCPGSCAEASPGVFTFNLTRDGGYQAQIAWDSSVGAPCENAQCGSTPFTAPSFATQWRDVSGNTHAGAPASVGASPIIIEDLPRP